MTMTHPLLRPLTPALLALALTGCIGTGSHALRDVPVPARYGHGDPAANTPDSVATHTLARVPGDIRDDPWWDGFGDPRLSALVRQVLERNNDLAAAGLRLERARLSAGLSANALWPQPGGSVSAGANRPIDTGADWSRSHSASVSVGWELDLWGKLRGQRDQAAWEAQATAEDLQSTGLLLVKDTCRLYWQLAYANQAIATGQANLERLERTQQLVQARFDAGEVSRLEVRQAAQNLAAQRASQRQLEQSRVETRNALTVLLDGQPWPLDDEPKDLSAAVSPALHGGLPAELLGRRPDLRAAELRLRSSLRNIAVTKASYYPALSLSGSVGGSSTQLADVLRNPVASLGAGLTLPFLNLPQARLNTAIAGTDYEIAATTFRTTLYTALSEVDNALSARESLADQVAAVQASYDEAVAIERMQGVRYRAGATDLQTWLEAQQTLRAAELSLAQTRQQQLFNDATLFQVLGGSDGMAAP